MKSERKKEGARKGSAIEQKRLKEGDDRLKE